MTASQLIFRKLALTDTDFYYQLTGDPKVMEFISGAAHSREESEAELRRVIDKFQQDSIQGVWVAQDPQSKKVVGVGALIPMQSGELEIGYRVLSEAWGNGYGTSICRKLIQIAESHQFRKLVARVASKNRPSIRILEKAGFSFITYEENEHQDQIFYLNLIQ